MSTSGDPLRVGEFVSGATRFLTLSLVHRVRFHDHRRPFPVSMTRIVSLILLIERLVNSDAAASATIAPVCPQSNTLTV
jgi:hypothetical protein